MIYIAMHKQVDVPQIKSYVPFQVGEAINKNWGIVGDGTGDNISVKNKDFCELTGIYWIWKNVKDDYKELVHYRRIFSKSNICNGVNTIYEYEELVEKLKTADVVMPYVESFKQSTKDEILISSCTEEIFDKLRSIILDKYPDYMLEFDEFFANSKSTLFNMMFCSSKVFDSYCQWLFDILFELEDWITENNIEYPARLYGFLSERLLNVWVMHNKLKVDNTCVWHAEMKLCERLQLLRRRVTNKVRFLIKV